MEPAREHSHDSSPASSPLARDEKSPVLTEKTGRANSTSNTPETTSVVSKRTGKPLRFVGEYSLSEEACAAAEAELAANPSQIDGFPLSDSEHLIDLAQQIANRARGEGNAAVDAEPELAQAAATLLNLVVDLALNAPQAGQGQICREFLARLTPKLVSQKKALIARATNVTERDKIKALFRDKDLRRGSDSTRLVQAAIRHFSDVYDLMDGGPPSKEEELVLKYKKFFRGEFLSKEEEDAMFQEMIFPWIANLPEEQLAKYYSILIKNANSLIGNKRFRIKTLPAALRSPCKASWHTIVKRNNRFADPEFT
jgi:hypothetical protein